jgi:hypothetical protein
MTLYKYLNPERIDVVENLKIRFTQPLYLNDPYETNPVITGYDTSEEQWEKIGRIECERNGFNYEDYKHLNVRKVRDALFPRTLQLMQIFFQHQTGILSLSEKHDNPLMWSHYCSNHEGFVIQFNSDHSFFRSNLQEYTVDNVCRVIYSKKRPNSTLEKLTMKDLYFTKSNVWGYEKEWRILKTIKKAETKITNEISLFDIPKEVIKAIYLGAACTDELESRLLNAVKINKVDCVIYKMVLNPTNYRIDTISITEWNELKISLGNESNILRAMTDDIRDYLYNQE